LSQWLGERYRLQTLFTESLFVADTAGVPIADFPVQPERRGVTYADRDYIQGAAAGRVTIGSPVIGRMARKPILPMAVPLLDKAGRVRAVLAGITGIDASGFLAFPAQSRIGNYGGFLLVSPRDRLFVAATQPEMALTPTPPVGVNLLHDKAMAGYRGSGVTVNARGREEISGMASVPSTGWFVVARISTEEALATVARTQRYLGVSSAVVVVLISVLATLGLLLIFRPVFLAARHADRMTRGESVLEPLPLVRQDEIGHLTAAFNRLLARLTASQAELQRAAHHDALTGLANRFLFADRLAHALAQRQAHGADVPGPGRLQAHQRRTGPRGRRCGAGGGEPAPGRPGARGRHAGAHGRRRVHGADGRSGRAARERGGGGAGCGPEMPAGTARARGRDGPGAARHRLHRPGHRQRPKFRRGVATRRRRGHVQRQAQRR
jgi:HAMP domain-containing protein